MTVSFASDPCFSPDRSSVEYEVRLRPFGDTRCYDYYCQFIYPDGSVSDRDMRSLFSYEMIGKDYIFQRTIGTKRNREGLLPVKLRIGTLYYNPEHEERRIAPACSTFRAFSPGTAYDNPKTKGGTRKKSGFSRAIDIIGWTCIILVAIMAILIGISQV